MNFYRQARVIGITANTAFNLDSSEYKHKGILLPITGSPYTVSMIMYDPNNSNPSGITLGVVSSSANPYIFPGVVKSITSSVNTNIALLS